MVRSKKPCGLDVAISVNCHRSVAIFTTSLESQESYLTLSNLISQTCLSITQDFFRLHGTFTQLYNAAASPASRLCSAGSLAIKILQSWGIEHKAFFIGSDKGLTLKNSASYSLYSGNFDLTNFLYTKVTSKLTFNLMHT